MDKEQALNFLRRIKQNPDDDTPRLVFADWLGEQGETGRAEFIRLQCRRATLEPENPEASCLAAREREVLDRDGQAWLAPLDPYRLTYNPPTFRRGLVQFEADRKLATADPLQ